MRRVMQAVPISLNANFNSNKRIYTRFHRKPQLYPTNFQENSSYKVEAPIEQDNMNNYISNIYKEKKYRGILDPTSPNNKNIFIDTDSEPQKSEIDQGEAHQKHKKSAKLLIAKTESQFPETYNSQNVFRRDGLIKGYFVKIDENKNKNVNNLYNTYNTLTKNSRMERVYMNTPSPEQDYNYNKMAQTQVRPKRINMNNFNQTYNRNTVNNGFFRKEIDLDEWPSVEKVQNSKLYYGNKDIQIGDKIDNQNQYNNLMIYRKGNAPEIKGSYSKSNNSEISEDYLNQYKRQPIERNYIIAGNTSEIGSPMEYKNNNYILGTSEDESDHQGELIFYNNADHHNYMNKRIKVDEGKNPNLGGQDHGGKVNLNYGMMNKGKDNIIRNKNIMIQRNRNIINEIRYDREKLNALIKLQKFIKSYLYLREICAMKIQAVWRGGNTRRIMELYNDLDEFIYHLSKVQFNHFNNDFCFFIKQLFNIYKAKVSNGNFLDESENNENNEEENDNENCMNQLTLEEIEKKEDIVGYSYKFPEGSCFAPEKLELENEIALFVKASSPYYEGKRETNSREYERLIKDYEELYQQYNELKENKNNNIFIPKKEKNESELTIGSAKSDNKKFGFNSIKKGSAKKKKTGKNLTFSNDYDADLDINRNDDFFNQDISYDDKDNSGSLIKDKRYSYFSIHSDENSKYFDNENIKERENKEGDNYKINTSKNSGVYNNNSTKNTGYTGYSSLADKSKLIGLHKTDKISKNDFSNNSPSVEKSNNYIGHHSKTFPRKYKNYNESNNSTLIIPKHEEDFNIINKKFFLSPKDREEIILKNIHSDIAITPRAKFEDKNWNEIIEYIKNEEIEIPTQKRVKNTKNKQEFKFDVLEKEKNSEINIDNKDYRNKKLNEIYIEHENELSFRKSKNNLEEKKSLKKSIESKDKQIEEFKKKLEEMKNSMKPKIFDEELQINTNLNSLNINGIKEEKRKVCFNKMKIDEIILSQMIKAQIPIISKNDEFSIEKNKIETNEKITDTNDLIPKEIKITTKKILKKTDTIKYKFKNNFISSESKLNINGKEKLKQVFEEQSQENNRFTIDKIIKEDKKIIKEDNRNEGENDLKVKIIKPEDLKIASPFSYNIYLEEEKLKKKINELIAMNKKEIFDMIRNNEISLNPQNKKEIKIVTKKVLKKTNVIYSKFSNTKTIMSSQNKLDIQGSAIPKAQLSTAEIEQLQKIKEKISTKFEDNEVSNENIININGIGKKFNNIKLQNDEDKCRFFFENKNYIPIIDKKDKKYNNIINIKSQFSFNGRNKKAEVNIINTKSKFTISGKEKIHKEMKEEGIQFEYNKDYLNEKMTDTSDLIPKEIKITMKKTVKKTNILKKHVNNIIIPIDQIKIEGIQKPEEENIKVSNEEKKENKDWKKLLKKDPQQYNFTIKRMEEYIKAKNIKDNHNIEGEKKIEVLINEPNKKIEIDWNKIIKKESQQNLKIGQNIKSLKDNKINYIIVKKINLNIESEKSPKKEKISAKIINIEDWISSLKEEKQHIKLIIENSKDNEKPKKQEELNLQNNIEINIQPKDVLPMAKKKVMKNWKETISEEKLENINIENQKKREIKITTRKILKKTNNIYKKFGNNLTISKNQLDIEGKSKMKSSDFSSENMQININKSYAQKKNEKLEIEKDKELFIKANKSNKREIQIKTKKKISRTNYIYKRFNNNLIANESKIKIEGIYSKPTIISSFINEKLEKVEIPQNKFTINGMEDNKKEQELKIKIQKEIEWQMNTKLEKEKEELKEKLLKENNDLKSENEELRKMEHKREKEIIAQKQTIFENLLPIATEEFEFEGLEINEYREKGDLHNDDYSLTHNELFFEKMQKESKELSEQGIQIEEIKPEQEEKTTDTFDLEKKEIKINYKKILKKTNVLKHKFNDNSICSDTKLYINNQNKEKNNVINKIKSFSIQKKKIEKNNKEENETEINKHIKLEKKKENEIDEKKEKAEIDKEKEIKTEFKQIENERNSFQIRRSIDLSYKRKKKLSNNFIKEENNVQLYDDKMPLNEENKTEQAFVDLNQLSQDKLQSPNCITDKNDTEINAIPHGHIINIVYKENENNEEDKKLYKKRKVMNTKIIRGSNKKRKFANLVIKLDNKFELKKSFNKWNNLSQMKDLDKNKSNNIKQIMKNYNKMKVEKFDDVNERCTDTTNSDTIQRKTNENNNNFENININKIENVKEGNSSIIIYKLMSQNKMLIIRHFFFKWNKNKKISENEGKSIIGNILRTYIIKCLIMHGKISQFKKILIKYSMNLHK